MTSSTSLPRYLGAWLLRLGLGVLLAVAGWLKLRDPAGFAIEISNYQLLPSLAAYPAVILPATELVLGLGLIVAPAPWRRAATVGVAILFLMFTVAVTSAYVRGINIACGCFGGGGDAIGSLTLVRNLALLLGISALWVWDAPPRRAARSMPAQPS
jgi:putative oxidoreductase